MRIPPFFFSLSKGVNDSSNTLNICQSGSFEYSLVKFVKHTQKSGIERVNGESPKSASNHDYSHTLTYDDPLPLHDLSLGGATLTRLIHIQLQVIKLLLQLGNELLLSVHCAQVLLSLISFPFVSFGLRMVVRVFHVITKKKI